jgi:CubicO group peptidase (beta-lactamase class C family)
MIVAFLLFFSTATGAAAGTQSQRALSLRESDLEPIGDIVRAQIEAGRIPGAVVVIGQGDGVVYRHAFGYRELKPQRIAMTPDTIFDLASLTKPVATSIAVMQLHERGKLDLNAPVARYWPRFATNGKERTPFAN